MLKDLINVLNGDAHFDHWVLGSDVGRAKPSGPIFVGTNAKVLNSIIIANEVSDGENLAVLSAKPSPLAWQHVLFSNDILSGARANCTSAVAAESFPLIGSMCRILLLCLFLHW